MISYGYYTFITTTDSLHYNQSKMKTKQKMDGNKLRPPHCLNMKIIYLRLHEKLLLFIIQSQKIFATATETKIKAIFCL